MLTFSSHVDGFYDVSDQMIDDLRRRAEAHFRRQERERAERTTLAAFEEHRARMRVRFVDAIGGLPEERTPLNASRSLRFRRRSFRVSSLCVWHEAR